MPVRKLISLIADAKETRDKAKVQRRQFHMNIKRAEKALDRAISLAGELDMGSACTEALFMAASVVEDVTGECNEQTRGRTK